MSAGSEGEWHGDFGHLMGHIFHSFATGPSFDQGFKFSHSIPSQHQLVDVCEILRRQLASTLVNIKESNQGDTGGLLGDEYIAVSIVQKINELGHDTDKLSAVCKAAKRTGAGLAEQTELMQHRVHKLRSWIEKLQTSGRAAIAFKGPPGCGHPSCANAHLNPVLTTGKNADLPNEYEGQYPSSHMQTTVDPVKAADEAMQQLLLEGAFSTCSAGVSNKYGSASSVKCWYVFGLRQQFRLTSSAISCGLLCWCSSLKLPDEWNTRLGAFCRGS